MNYREKDNNIAGQKLVRIYRGWDRLERRTGKEIEVIDIDIAPPALRPYDFANRSEVMGAFFDNALGFDTSSLDGRYLVDKARASHAYIQDLEAGDSLSQTLPDYMDRTMGIVMQVVSRSILDQRRLENEDRFRALGYAYNPQGWCNFVKGNGIDIKRFKRDFPIAVEKLKPHMMAALGGEELQADYNVETVELDETWLNWVSGNSRNLTLRVNLHERNRNRWHKGTEEAMAVHEVFGHIYQILKFKENIQREDKPSNPGYGIFSIPGPEQWELEGLATTLSLLVPGIYENLSPEGQFAVQYRVLSQLVYNNTQIDLNGKRPSIEKELVNRVQYYLPGEPEDRIKKVLIDQTKHPRNRSYMMAYQSGTRFFWEKSTVLSDKQKRTLLRRLYSQPMTHAQVKELIDREIQSLEAVAV